MLARLLAAGLLVAGAALAAIPAELDGETLHYTVNWPSGLSLGEGEFKAGKLKGSGAERWEFRFQVDANVPGFAVKDRYRSVAAGDFCSVEFSKQTAHGKRQTDETTTIDPASGAATRVTKGGGSGAMQAAVCVKDSLTFLYFLRSELIKGRVPPAQAVLSGAAYQVRTEFRGAQRTTVADEPVQADRVVVSLKGPASQHTFDIFFARDAARTPLVVLLPLPSGAVRMELVR